MRTTLHTRRDQTKKKRQLDSQMRQGKQLQGVTARMRTVSCDGKNVFCADKKFSFSGMLCVSEFLSSGNIKVNVVFPEIIVLGFLKQTVIFSGLYLTVWVGFNFMFS